MGSMLPAMHCYVVSRDIWNEKITFLTLSLVKPRWNAEAFWKSYELFVYRNIYSMYCLHVNVYCTAATGCQPSSSLLAWIAFLNNFFLLVVVDFCWHKVKKNTQVKYHVHLFILHSLYWISCCWMQAIFCQCCPLHIQGWAGLRLKVVFCMLTIVLESVHVVTDAKAWCSKPTRFTILLFVAHGVKLSVCR